MKRLMVYLITFVGFTAYGATDFSAGKSFEVCNTSTDATKNEALVFSLAVYRTRQPLEINVPLNNLAYIEKSHKIVPKYLEPAFSLLEHAAGALENSEARVTDQNTKVELSADEKTELANALKYHFGSATVTPKGSSYCFQIKLHPAEMGLSHAQHQVANDVMDEMSYISNAARNPIKPNLYRQSTGTPIKSYSQADR